MLAILVVVYSLMKRGREERGRGHDVPLECIAIQLLVEKYVHVSVSLLVVLLMLRVCWNMLVDVVDCVCYITCIEISRWFVW